MRRVTADIAAKKQKLAQHRPATAESRSAQDAAKAPPDDKEAQGKAANAEKMNAAKPGEFDKVAFIAAVNEAIAAQAPKNLDEADKFADSGKAEKVKGAVDGKVTDGKKASAKDIETTTKAAPDTSKAKEKQVVPMRPDQPPANPGAPSAEDATPRPQPPEVTDFSEGPRKTDQQMADADVTEEQLARSNEPEFTAALGEKRKAEQHSATAPAQARTAEKAQLATAKSGAAAAGAQAMSALTATRTAAGKQVDGGKGEAKSKDEQKRAEVTARLQKVFDATQKDVEGILEGLDGKVDKQFEEGEKKARDAFTTDQKRRMKAYKDKRYGGFWGPAKWAKDKIAGMPEEANQLFQESRKLYVRMMQGVISSIADTIGTDLGKAKARIAKGRAELKAEVDKLPADLKKYGEEAAKDFAGKFDDLESEVDDKSKQLVQTLAQKYTQALNAVDEEIKKLQEANKGLVQKAVDAVAGVIKTIKELKDLLMGILAKAAAAITKIIKDPIGFLGNLVRAVGAGLQQFVSNIGTHLQSGLVSWLLGTAVKAGIEIPSRFDLKGIIQLIASLLGLTWANIRARITRKGVPDQAMNTVEQSVPVAKALATEGPAGAVNEIQAEVGDLKSTILEELKSYLIPTVIIAGITWIISLLNPASAFVRAVKGIIDIVSFIVNQGAQIVQFVNAVLDAVVAIAGGGSAGVPKMVETALAASVPLLIGFLASLLGIGGLANKIRQVFQKVARPVNRAIDKVAAKIAAFGKKIWVKLKSKAKGKDSKSADGTGPSGKLDAKAISVDAKAAVERLGRGPFAREEVDAALAPVRTKYRTATITSEDNLSAHWGVHVQTARADSRTNAFDIKGAHEEIYKSLSTPQSRAMLNQLQTTGGIAYTTTLRELIPKSDAVREQMLAKGYKNYTDPKKSGLPVDRLKRQRQRIEIILRHGIAEERKRSGDEACASMRQQMQALEQELARIGDRLSDGSGWSEAEEKHVEFQLNEIAENLLKISQSHGYESEELLKHPSKYAVNGRLKNNYAKDVRRYFYPSGFTAAAEGEVFDRDLPVMIKRKEDHPELKNQTGYKDDEYFYCSGVPSKSNRPPHIAPTSAASVDHMTPVASHWNAPGHGGSTGSNTHQLKRKDWYNMVSNLTLLCGPCNSAKQSGGVNYMPEVGPLFKGPDDP
ncbi:hypothetical protein ACH40D_23270 [Streptomyces olivaceoviridis]|uniref:HNH endonuclease n=1 Tax=Streptomyces olivaceoviridis TaxID=1921 RepID=A0ABW7V554_STROI|nr:hypothetical protein [Streptomyces corchorusii]